MKNLSKIAVRNLRRYSRRSLLTISLIAFGVIFVLVFVAVTGSFKQLITTQITESYLSDLQIHRQGYVASIESLPLNLNLSPAEVTRVEAALAGTSAVQASSPRIKFGGMFSNFTETTNIRINGVDPDREFATCPQMASRMIQGEQGVSALQRGTILVPELLARGFGTTLGDTVVVVATNKDGSVNGKTLVVSGILESATGPGGRDGYIHFDDAREILRMPEPEVSEIAVRLTDLGQVDRVAQSLRAQLTADTPESANGRVEVHTWAQLSPFANIARMIDVMTLFIKLMLITVVLVSILNVMIMAVYERVREIGTIAAIGTLPGRILSLFLVEGLFLGISGAVVGVLVGTGIILVLNIFKIAVAFGQSKALLLAPTIAPWDVFTASLMVIVVSILASAQPAYKASRMEPIEALRHV
jgi:putative ABC transport system permease protein